MFSPDQIVFENVAYSSLFGQPSPLFIQAPNGQQMLAAIPGQLETKTYWLTDGAHYDQITKDMAFVQNLWMHYAHGPNFAAALDPMSDMPLARLGLAESYHIADAALLSAAHEMHIAFTDAQILDYAHWVAPEIVGVP